MRYFIVSLNNVLSQGPFTVYFNQISSGNIPLIYGTTGYAENLTSEQISSEIVVEVPDNTTSIIIFDNDY